MKRSSGSSIYIKRFLETQRQEETKSPAALGQKTAVELITSHLISSISTKCDIKSDAADFAARSTHPENEVYNYAISRQNSG